MRSLAPLALLPLIAIGCDGSSADGDGRGGHHPFSGVGAAATSPYDEAWLENHDEGAEEPPYEYCSGVRPPDDGPFGKHVALTFDDGPNPATTPQVIATLRAHAAPATFFINGWRVDGRAARDLVAAEAADPMFKVGNHTWSHDDLRTLTAEQRAIEIDDTAAIITAAGEPLDYFRFPYGASTCETAAEVRERGYKITGWHVDSADWCFAAGDGHCDEETFAFVDDAYRDDMLGFTLKQVREHRGGIVLFHDVHANTAQHLDAILTALEDEGYTFVGLDDDRLFPLLDGKPPRFMGDACEVSDDCTYADALCVGGTVSAGRCSRACNTGCPDREDQPLTRCAELADPAEPDGPAMNLCAIECGEGGACPTGLACGSYVAVYDGAARDLCW